LWGESGEHQHFTPTRVAGTLCMRPTRGFLVDCCPPWSGSRASPVPVRDDANHRGSRCWLPSSPSFLTTGLPADIGSGARDRRITWPAGVLRRVGGGRHRPRCRPSMESHVEMGRGPGRCTRRGEGPYGEAEIALAVYWFGKFLLVRGSCGACWRCSSNRTGRAAVAWTRVGRGAACSGSPGAGVGGPRRTWRRWPRAAGRGLGTRRQCRVGLGPRSCWRAVFGRALRAHYCAAGR